MTDGGGTEPIFRAHPDRDGVRIDDPIENGQFALFTDDPVEPEPCDTDEFAFPVSTAARIDADRVRTPYRINLYIRDREGSLLAECNDDSGASVSRDQYLIEFASTRLKLYALVESAIDAHWDGDTTVVEFSSGSFRLGARSLHQRPAGTVTTTDDPADLMAAISTFGSALKTTSPERSFPTLRGHPPEIERGSKLDVPDGLEMPETGVRIEVPAEYEYVYPVASLAFYLGATVEPADRPRLVAGGETFPLTHPDFETAVERTLEQVFLLDCVTRTEGLYSVTLHEREQVEPELDLDFAALYETPLAERTAEYLSVTYEAVEEQVPWFRLTAHVVPNPEHAPVLPFLADDLALIRSIEPPSKTRLADDVTDKIEAMFEPPLPDSGTNPAEATVRSAGRGPTTEDVFRLPDAETMEQVYVGDGVPVGAGKLSVDACRRALEHEPREKAETRVAIVHNDTELRDDNIRRELFESQNEHPIDIELFDELSREELKKVLREDRSFLHYIGHIDDRGFRCRDGYLDAWQLESVEVDAFILNACKSYSQGQALIEKGSLGGIVTTSEVEDGTAASIGSKFAGLLDNGFSISGALKITAEFVENGPQYLVVGNGSIRTTSCEATPHLVLIDERSSKRVTGRYRFFATESYEQGTLQLPYIRDNEIMCLSRRNFEFQASLKTTVKRIGNTTPLVIDDEIYCAERESSEDLLLDEV
ncbi:MAG: hypothetical protein ABEI57_00290 [Halapricum sp.]